MSFSESTSKVTGFNELQEYDIELHENIRRKQFTPLEEAEALEKRKEIYERLYPETKQHIAGAVAKHASVKTTLAPSFTKSTADITGYSKSAIEKKLQLTKLPEEYKERLRCGEKVTKVL